MLLLPKKMKNIFNINVANEVTDRINRLTPTTKPKWGKMNVAQMLAHCNVTYELVYDSKHPKPGAFMRFILKLLVKPNVVSDKPYKKDGQTAPVFQVKGEKDFASERSRLINFIKRTQELGEAHFNNRESHSFGKLTSTEWNNMFYKHLDHHLTQFGV
jgi:hypothetical protein